MVAKMLLYIFYCGHLQGTDQKQNVIKSRCCLNKETSLYNKWRPLQKTIVNQNSELWSPQAMHIPTKHFQHLRLRKQCRRDRGKSGRSRETWTLLWILVSYDITKYIHKILPTWLPKYDLHKDNINELAKMFGEKSLNLNPKRRTRGNWSENWRRGLSYTRMQYLFVQC